MTEYAEIIEFSHEKDSKYDLETYMGRFSHFQTIINPKSFISSKNLRIFSIGIYFIQTKHCKIILHC